MIDALKSAHSGSTTICPDAERQKSKSLPRLLQSCTLSPKEASEAPTRYKALGCMGVLSELPRFQPTHQPHLCLKQRYVVSKHRRVVSTVMEMMRRYRMAVGLIKTAAPRLITLANGLHDVTAARR